MPDPPTWLSNTAIEESEPERVMIRYVFKRV